MSEVSIQVDVAESLLELIPTLDLGLEFECERSYADWELPLKKQSPLRVDIVPASKVDSEHVAHDTMRLEPKTQIVVRKKFDGDSSDEDTGRIENAEIDTLMLFTEKLFLALVARRLGDGDAAAWKSEELVASHMPSHLRSHRQYTGIINVTHASYHQIGA